MLKALLHKLFAMPLLGKVLVANSLLIFVGAFFGTWITAAHVPTSPPHVHDLHWELMLYFAVPGVAISVLINYLLLKAAFSPLSALQRTVEEVRKGNLQARMERSLFSDLQIDRLADTLEGMLETIETHRQQLRLLSSQIIAAQEGERKRIARELHDQTAQALTSLLVHLKLLESCSDLEEAKARATELRSLTAETLDEVRRMALELRPTTLDDLGLIPALRWYTQEYSEKWSTKVEFKAMGFEERLPAEMELVLYRVVQEALTNIAKHSRASQAKVVLERKGRNVSATIEDNGRGFDVPKVLSSKDRGLGLFGMQERATLVGGRLSIESTPGTGTRIYLEAPLDGIGGG